MADRLRIAIVDDHPLFREGVLHTLCSSKFLEVVGEGDSAEDAVRIAREALPDIMLLDVRMPGGGIEAASSIARVCPKVKIIMVTVSESEQDVAQALEVGSQRHERSRASQDNPRGFQGRILHHAQAGRVPPVAGHTAVDGTRTPSPRSSSAWLDQQRGWTNLAAQREGHQAPYDEQHEKTAGAQPGAGGCGVSECARPDEQERGCHVQGSFH